MTKEAMTLALEDYLSREMPAGTVIGDPKWWAGKIANVIAKQENGENQDDSCQSYWEKLARKRHAEILELREKLKQEQPIKDVVVNADYREMWKQQVEMNQQLTAALSAQPAKQEQGEPVAWSYKSEPSFDGNKWHDTYELTASKQVALWKDKDAKPLYTHPQPKREWVGLTEQEAAECWSTSTVRTWKSIEAKLKEKNT